MATNMFKDLFTLHDFMLFDNNHDMRLNFNSKVPLNNFKGKTKQNRKPHSAALLLCIVVVTPSLNFLSFQ